jgi:DNA adenine methylase
MTIAQNRISPFLRWAGGKQWLTNLISKYLKTSNLYFEPFLGGGSLLFSFLPKKAIVGDINQQLVDTYKVVKEYPHELIFELEHLTNDELTYYRLRKEDNKNPILQAARFIFLNKTCWNGLYRVNRNGQFNVPFG